MVGLSQRCPLASPAHRDYPDCPRGWELVQQITQYSLETKAAWKPGQSCQNSLTDTAMSWGFHSNLRVGITWGSLKIIGAWAPTTTDSLKQL